MPGSAPPVDEAVGDAQTREVARLAQAHLRDGCERSAAAQHLHEPRQEPSCLGRAARAQRGAGIVGRDGHAALQQDGAGVDVLVDEVKADTAFALSVEYGRGVGVGSAMGRQQRRMAVHEPHTGCLQDLAPKDFSPASDEHTIRAQAREGSRERSPVDAIATYLGESPVAHEAQQATIVRIGQGATASDATPAKHP